MFNFVNLCADGLVQTHVLGPMWVYVLKFQRGSGVLDWALWGRANYA